MKTSFPCFSADIEDLPPAVQEKLFDEVLDRDVQKGTEDVILYILCHILNLSSCMFSAIHVLQ